MNPEQHHVVVLGASPKPARFANQAQRLLMEKGFKVTPVHPRFDEIYGLPVVNDLGEISETIHTLTLYVSAQHLEPQIDTLMELAPKRVIFNPGTELAPYQDRLDQEGIEWVEDCTLIMLRTGQF